MNKRTMLLLLTILTSSESLLQSMERPLKRTAPSPLFDTSDDETATGQQVPFFPFNLNPGIDATSQSLQIVNDSLLHGLLFAAASSLDPQAALDIEELIQQGVDPNTRYMQGNTALHLAALAGNFATVRSLVSLGAHVNVLNDYRMTPLHCAVDTAREKTKHLRAIIIIFLIHNGANKWCTPEYIPLKHAALHGDLDACNSLMRTLPTPLADNALLNERITYDLLLLKTELSKKDVSNNTMQDVANNLGHPEIALLLNKETTEQFKSALFNSSI